MGGDTLRNFAGDFPFGISCHCCDIDHHVVLIRLVHRSEACRHHEFKLHFCLAGGLASALARPGNRNRYAHEIERRGECELYLVTSRCCRSIFGKKEAISETWMHAFSFDRYRDLMPSGLSTASVYVVTEHVVATVILRGLPKALDEVSATEKGFAPGIFRKKLKRAVSILSFP